MVNALLTIAAAIWVYRRTLVELVGLALIVAAAALWIPIVGLLVAGVALILAANFSSR